MRYEDKLRRIGEFAEILRILRNIYVIERRFDLVEDTERRRLYFKYREVNAYRNECLLTTRKK